MSSLIARKSKGEIVTKVDTKIAPKERLYQLFSKIERDYQHFLGFPASLDFDYQDLAPFLQRFLNNIGDPAIESWHTLSSKDIEQEVLAFFAELFRAKKNEWWGYVTNGSTECNLYALYLARHKFPRAKIYYSQAAHYSIPKNIHILAQEGVPVHTQPSGEMDYQDLRRQLAKDAGGPAIVVATIGTTMTEARDDVAKIKQTLTEAGVPDFFIHSDAALAGPYTALLQPHHPFDFADGADSVSISGHKFIGSPLPCGVIIVRKKDRDLLGSSANYTGSADTTISGSRSGHTPLFLWYALEQLGKDGLVRRAEQSLKVAEYTHRRLVALGWKAWRNPNALTVMLAAPSHELVVKWQLATQGEWSHIICMPGITTEKIDRFLHELQQGVAVA